MAKLLSTAIGFYRDRTYYQRVVELALPIIFQNFTFSVLNMVGVMMIGQLGEVSVAAVGLANQIWFLLNLLLFGITSGAAIFTAQFWGNGDIHGIRKVLGLSMVFSLASGFAFLLVAEVFPEIALGIYSKDAAVIALGAQYMRTFGWAYLFTSVTITYAIVLRSTGQVKIPVMVSIATLCLNIVLSYGLIFGNFGLPRLGVKGAAVAALTARVLECITLVWIVYRYKLPAAASIRDMCGISLGFTQTVLKRVLPVALNELLWSLGITTYYIVYARMGTQSIAAMNIASTIDNLAGVIFIGISNACAILVGNLIGAGEEKQAYRYAGRSLSLAIGGGFLVGGLILAFSGYILVFYKVSPVVIQYTRSILVVLACFLFVRVSNMVVFIGILRSGGDTRYAFFLDAGIIWVVGVPLALLGAFVFHLPVYWVYLLVMADEVTKFILAVFRYFSKKWIHNLAQVSSEG